MCEETYKPGAVASAKNPATNTITNTETTLQQYSPNMYSVCDAYWIFTPKGGEFIKDGAALGLIKEREISLAMNHNP